VGAAPPELALLQRQMASINEAYAALRAAPVDSPPADPYPKPAVPARPPPPLGSRRPRRRAWPYVLLAIVILGAAVGVVAAATAHQPEKGVGTTWGVGACVQGTDDPAAVRCDGPHDGEIVDAKSDPNDCPDTSEGFVAERGYIWCIDTDR
jgi:hypothetical protein